MHNANHPSELRLRQSDLRNDCDVSSRLCAELLATTAGILRHYAEHVHHLHIL